MPRDYESNDLAGAAYLAADYDYDGPTRAEAELDMHEHESSFCCFPTERDLNE